MSNRGVFAIDRGIFDHQIFAPEPYTEREAWIWMIGAAAWKAQRVRVGRHTISLERGQLAFSTRFLASKFKWSQGKMISPKSQSEHRRERLRGRKASP